jgi:hypothetical protein
VKGEDKHTTWSRAFGCGQGQVQGQILATGAHANDRRLIAHATAEAYFRGDRLNFPLICHNCAISLFAAHSVKAQAARVAHRPAKPKLIPARRICSLKLILLLIDPLTGIRLIGLALQTDACTDERSRREEP